MCAGIGQECQTACPEGRKDLDHDKERGEDKRQQQPFDVTTGIATCP